MARTSASSRPLTNHDEIRHWAEERGAKPTSVRGTGRNGDIGMIRLDFPGYSGEGKLEEISWDEWFDKFDESGLALLVQERTAGGQKSNFNKLISRETAGISAGRTSSSGSQRHDRLRDTSRDEEDYEASAGYAEDDLESTDEDLEEEADVEESRPVRVSGAGSSRNRKRQGRTTGREATRRARSSATARRTGSQAGRSRNERSSRSRTASSKRGQATGGSRASSKKAPARAISSGSRASRGRGTRSRKRAA